MAASDLQNRLDYLVSYSSQLIFISGELARQTDVLETFIESAEEHVEVALLAANTSTPLAKYRETLFKQLISKIAENDFTRPLNLLLSDLNQHDGPVIISITKAENIPRKLLQELWALVLQSRFAGNRQHLNVLLFAEEGWAKQAQGALTTKTGDKPLLLTRSSSQLNLHLPSGAKLEKLIEQKRRQFSQSHKQSKNHPASKKGRYNKGLMIFSFFCAFILIFATLVKLLSPQSFVTLIEAFNFNQQQTQPLVGDLELPVIAIVNSDLNNRAADINLTNTPPPVNDTIEQEPEAPPTEVTGAPFVTTWRSAIKKVEETSSDFLLAKPQEALINQSSIKVDADAQDIPAAITPQQRLPDQAKTLQMAKNEGSSLTVLPVDLLQQNTTYLIQVAAMAEEYLLNQFTLENQLTDQVLMYTTRRFGGNWHVLVYARMYSSIEDAREAITKLPQVMQSQQPFVKSSRQISQELSQINR